MDKIEIIQELLNNEEQVLKHADTNKKTSYNC